MIDEPNTNQPEVPRTKVVNMSAPTKENILRIILNPKIKSGRVPPYDHELKLVMFCRGRRLEPPLFTGLIGYEGCWKDQWAHEIWIPR